MAKDGIITMVGAKRKSKEEESNSNDGENIDIRKMNNNAKAMNKCTHEKAMNECSSRGDSQVIISSGCGSSNVFDCGDIMREILSRLPVKSLVRFKCVSKHWKFVICRDQVLIDLQFSRSKQHSPDLFIVVPLHMKFDQQHRRTTPYNSRLRDRSGFKKRALKNRRDSWFEYTRMYGGASVYTYEQSVLLSNLFEKSTIPAISVMRLERPQSFHYTEVLNPLNGLICFVNRCYAAVRILNPSTRQRTPWIASSLCRNKNFNFVAENERGIWFPTYFFGSDPATKRHKVICTWRVRKPGTGIYLRSGDIQQTNICEVLTVGENRWRRIKAEVPSYSYHVEKYVYANGFIYWHSDSAGFLNAFDVGCEKFTVIEVPKEIREKCTNPDPYYDISSGLIEVGGKIAIAQQWDGNVVKLWICGDDASICSYSSWTEATLELPFRPDNKRSWHNSISVFFHSVAGADRIVIESNPTDCRPDTICIKEATLYSYNWEKKTLTGKVKSGVLSKLVSKSLSCELVSVSLFTPFVESLWPVQTHQPTPSSHEIVDEEEDEEVLEIAINSLKFEINNLEADEELNTGGKLRPRHDLR